MSTVGDIIGVAIAGQLMDLIGRKHNLAAGCVFTSVGIFMQIFSHEWKLFLGGRLINGKSLSSPSEETFRGRWTVLSRGRAHSGLSYRFRNGPGTRARLDRGDGSPRATWMFSMYPELLHCLRTVYSCVSNSQYTCTVDVVGLFSADHRTP